MPKSNVINRPDIKILSETELRKVISLDHDTVDCIESAFKTLAGGKVVMPPILSMAIEEFNGEVDVKTAYVPGVDSFAIKMSPGFFDNPKQGLPTTSGLMILFSAKTGMTEALLLDNGYLTDVRTAAAGAVAAKHLSRPDSHGVCVLGAGAQARLQLEALCLVRPITQATIWARDAQKAEKTATELRDQLGIDVSPTQLLSASVSAADIVITATAAASPLVMADWLQPGQHVTAMGSDQHHKNELEPTCITRADLYTPDRLSQTQRLGELHHAITAGLVAADAEFAELGAIVAGVSPGRTSADQITVCDLTGTGLQDTAIATLARQRADAISAGTAFSS